MKAAFVYASSFAVTLGVGAAVDVYVLGHFEDYGASGTFVTLLVVIVLLGLIGAVLHALGQRFLGRSQRSSVRAAFACGVVTAAIFWGLAALMAAEHPRLVNWLFWCVAATLPLASGRVGGQRVGG